MLSSAFTEPPESANVHQIPAYYKDQGVPGPIWLLTLPPLNPSNDRRAGAYDVHLVSNWDIRRMTAIRSEAEHCAIQRRTTGQTAQTTKACKKGLDVGRDQREFMR